MTFAPRQNWNAYHNAIDKHLARKDQSGVPLDDPARMETAFYRYADFVDTLQTARRGLCTLSEEQLVEERLARWTEKIALREKLISIYQKLDASRNG